MWFVLLPLLFFLFYLYRKSRQNLFRKLGIPGPEPHWFFGNLLCHNKEYPEFLWIRKCTKQYGKIWGFYEGPIPCLVISDPEYVQDIFVKQFSNFHARKLFILHENSKSPRYVNMFNANGERWKRLRTIVNPAFTEFKMRKMFPLMRKCIDVLISQFEEHSAKEESFDIFDFYKRLTFEVIGECAFGITINAQTEVQPDSLYRRIKRLLELFERRNFLIVLAEASPELSSIIRKFFRLLTVVVPSRSGIHYIRKRLGEIIEERKENASLRRTDILQLMVDAELPEGTQISPEFGGKRLHMSEIIPQSLLFLLAGYETSSTALALITHALATHPDVQERLQAEIDSLYETCEDPDQLELKSDHLAGMEYMNQVISETLRFYPIGASVVSRKCMTDTSMCGFHIPQGTHVVADVGSLHFDPALWGPTDPEVFDPERFADTTKRDASFLAFGIGPRFCIGQRFALTEIRAVLFRLLRRFNIRTCAATEVPLKLKYRPTVGPANRVDVVLRARKV